MPEVSTFRLYLLRGTYLLLGVGIGLDVWPGLFNPPADLDLMRGMVRSLLGGVSLVALLGIRYPLKMLPLMLFELVWKSIWVLAFGLPRWWAGAMDEGTRGTMKACLMVLVVFPLVIPWRHVLANYLKMPGDRWRGTSVVARAPGSD